jgi:hypothetical protein
VDDIGRGDVERDGGVRRNHHLVEVVERLGARIVVAPQELLPIDIDVERAAARRRGALVDGGKLRGARKGAGSGAWRVLDVVEVDESHEREHDDDRRGRDRPADLERRVAADLGRRWAAAAAPVAPDRPDQRPLDDQEDDDPDVEGDALERVYVVCIGRAPRIRRERTGHSVVRRAHERCQCQSTDEDRNGGGHEARVMASSQHARFERFGSAPPGGRSVPGTFAWFRGVRARQVFAARSAGEYTAACGRNNRVAAGFGRSPRYAPTNPHAAAPGQWAKRNRPGGLASFVSNVAWS